MYQDETLQSEYERGKLVAQTFQKNNVSFSMEHAVEARRFFEEQANNLSLSAEERRVYAKQAAFERGWLSAWD